MLKYMVLENTKKGNMGIESAILLPLVIIALFTLISVAKFHATSENIIYSLADEAEKLSIESSNLYGKIKTSNFKVNLKKRLENENKNCKNFKFEKYEYMIPKIYGIPFKRLDNIISIKVSYEETNNLMPIFKNDIIGSEEIKFRGFVGSKNYQALTFDEIEKEEIYEAVWIFPKNGKCYHKKNCRYISAHPTQLNMNSNIRKKNSPCKICKPKKIKNGDCVYCYLKGGKSYHLENCPVMKKYSVEVDKVEAEKKGYIPCSVCGGI